MSLLLICSKGFTMSIDKTLLQMKNEFETAILENGATAQTRLIRSQKLINILHNQVKSEFIKLGVKETLIYPCVGKCCPEVKISGSLKEKCQDICIIPQSVLQNQFILKKTKAKLVDNTNIEKVISINVRSQLSSLAKNIDTLYERTFAEALNLHLKYPKQCLGEVYLIPTHEYDSKAMKENKIKYKKVTKLEDYIHKFQFVNNRISADGQAHQYERVCLLIVDFSRLQPKLYSSIEELKKDDLIPQNSTLNMSDLSFENFALDLLRIYENRFRDDISEIKV